MNKAALISVLKKVYPALLFIESLGGKAYLVGGVVRDLVMNESINDIDIEVHGLSVEQLETALKKVGPLFYVGKQFGVYKIASVDIDWSLPRVDSSGRKPTVSIDPFLGIENACRRRDITMNAMALLLTSSLDQEFGLCALQIVDPFNGLDAIKNREIRLIDPELFVQDPLRFYRVMHFASRFNFQPDQRLTQLAKTISLTDPLTSASISSERIEAELKKMIIKGKVPSKGLVWVASLGRLSEFFPEWNSWMTDQDELLGSKSQFSDAMSDLDYAALLPRKKDDKLIDAPALPENSDSYYPFMLGLLAAHLIKPELWHDHVATRKQSALFFKQFSSQKSTFHSISLLLQGAVLFGEMKKSEQANQAYFLKKIAALLSPTWALYDLLVFMEILFFRKEEQDDQFQSWCKRAEDVAVLCAPEKPLLTGADFLIEGLTGIVVGDALAVAYDLQIKEELTDAVFLKKRVLDQLFLQNKK